MTAFREAVSPARFERYRPPNGTDIDAAITYQWNLALSEALYPSLAAVEVTLRSAIHRELTAQQGTEWWFNLLLQPGQLRDFGMAYTHVQPRKKAMLTAGHIVAELKFSFWVTLLSQPYNQTLWAPDKARLLRAVFPGLPATPNARDVLEKRYNGIRLLRNRVMHYEPIWLGMRLPNRPSVNIETFHDEIVEAIGWVSPVVRDSVEGMDRFDEVLRGRARVEAAFRAAHNMP